MRQTGLFGLSQRSWRLPKRFIINTGFSSLSFKAAPFP